MFIKLNLLVIIFFVSLTSVSAQQGFEKYFGNTGVNDNGFGVLQSRDGGYIICGSADLDGVLIKTDLNGNVVWQNTYPSCNFESIRETSDLGYILAGTDYNSPYAGVYKKTDSLGNEQWNVLLNSGAFSHYGLSALQMPDGSFALLENDTYPFQEYMRIWKIDSSSQSTFWTKEINKVSNCSPGSFISTHDSALVIACGDFSYPYPHLIFTKISSDSSTTWKKDFGFPTTTNAGFSGNSVIETRDSTYMIVGYKISGNPQSDYSLLLMMADANGDSLWTKNYYLKNSNDFPSIIQTRDGGFALIATVQYPSSGGSFDYRILLMKTNSDGDSVWSKEFTGLGINQAHQLIENSDGGFAIVGTSTDQQSNENFIYLIKTDSLGDLITSNKGIPYDEDQFSVFPNPAGDHFEIEIKNPTISSNLEMQLIDVTGRIVLNKALRNTHSIIPVNNTMPGLYHLKISDSQQTLFLKKIVLQ